MQILHPATIGIIMSIQSSLRVKKTFANLLASGENDLDGSQKSRTYVIFVSTNVPFPTTSQGAYQYFTSVLNYNTAYGGSPSNRANLLAWAPTMPGTTAGVTSPLSQVDDIASLLAFSDIIPINSGTIGSVFVISPLAHVGPEIMSDAKSGWCSPLTRIVTPADAGIGGTTNALGIPEGLGVNSGNTAALSTYYSGVQFATDSIGTSTSNTIVRVSTTNLTAGTPFRFFGYNLKCSSI